LWSNGSERHLYLRMYYPSLFQAFSSALLVYVRRTCTARTWYVCSMYCTRRTRSDLSLAGYVDGPPRARTQESGQPQAYLSGALCRSGRSSLRAQRGPLETLSVSTNAYVLYLRTYAYPSLVTYVRTHGRGQSFTDRAGAGGPEREREPAADGWMDGSTGDARRQRRKWAAPPTYGVTGTRVSCACAARWNEHNGSLVSHCRNGVYGSIAIAKYTGICHPKLVDTRSSFFIEQLL
jgi:hypothetical protein